MQTSIWLPLFTCFAAAIMTGAIVARAPGQRVNRLIALVLVCAGYWSFCDVLWSLGEDADRVVQIARFSSLGWMWLGPLCLHVYVELARNPRSLGRRLLPYSYAATAACVVLCVTTPWVIAEALRVDWGWSFRFAPGFLLVYLPTGLCVGYVLVKWPAFMARGASPAERRLAMSMFVAVTLSTSVATLTDVVLPTLGHHVPRLGSTSQLVLGSIVAWSVSRHGYFLLAPGAFAREILETLRDGVVLLDQDGAVRFGNADFAALMERPERTLAGARILEALPQLGEQALCDDFAGLETRLRRPDGSDIPVAVSSSGLCDENDRVVGRVLAIRDQSEVATLRSRVVTSGRLAAVGELAAGIAHEINNPITFVRANLAQLHEHWAELEATLDAAGNGESDAALAEGQELIEESLEGVDRVAGIVRDVRAFSHAGLGRAELADVNELLENAANVAALRYAVNVERCYGELPAVRCAPHQLRQVFLNLIVNAVHAIGEDGCIRLVTQRLRDAVVVRIQDDGCGIPARVIDRVFDPFFTTRPAGEGTGLGLALCFQIVRNHQGDIRVESEPGQGTCFFVHLPA